MVGPVFPNKDMRLSCVLSGNQAIGKKRHKPGMLLPRRVLAGNLMAKIALAEKVKFITLSAPHLPRCRVCRDEVAVASCGALGQLLWMARKPTVKEESNEIAIGLRSSQKICMSIVTIVFGVLSS